MKKFTFAIFCVGFVVIFGERVRYDGHRVFSIHVENEHQLKVLQELENGQDGLSFIEVATCVSQIAELVVAPSKFAYISELFITHKMKIKLKTENLQELIDAEQPPLMRKGGFSWTKYYDLDDIYAWLDQLLKQFSTVLTDIEYGKSYERRLLRAIKVSHKQGNPTIFIESTVHAREWISAATATFFLNELVTSNNSDIRYLAENYDWVIVPVVNVDGYQYTHTTNRLWRKTRKPSSSSCIGTDPNRNFDFHHAQNGASKNPCSEVFAGYEPFSEPEIYRLSNLIKKNEYVNNLKLYISFHSYSQLLLFPYGYTKAYAPNHNDLKNIGYRTTQAIRQRYGTEYVTGAIAQTLYPASGSSIDWVYGTQNVSLTYTFELRDQGKYGFLLPADQIIPNSLEVIDGIVAMVKEAKSLKYL